MAPAVAIGMAVVMAAAFATNIDLRPPALPGAPHVITAVPAEAIPPPVTLEFETVPELRPAAAPPVPAFEAPANVAPAAPQSEPVPADGAP
jgi:hypothetical protein